MHRDKVLMAAGVTAAAFVSAFILWGPSEVGTRRRRAQIAGLYNFGQTCFLNTLLQAFASCPTFIAWLHTYKAVSQKRKRLISAMLNSMEVINGTHATINDNPFSPNEVISAMDLHGWIIPQEEHDAHELFHVLLASLEEETMRPQPVGCLSDALPSMSCEGLKNSDGGRNQRIGDQKSSEKLLVNENKEQKDADDTERNTIAQNCLLSKSIPECQNLAEDKNLEIIQATSHYSLETLNRRPGVVSLRSSEISLQIAHPFQGAMGIQIICNTCGHKSTVCYDKFESVTLNLPSNQTSGLSIDYLLSEYIAPEELSGVKCDACYALCTHTKTSTFAKLPPCLCLHIARTEWHPTGEVCKRQDYVHFPESLSMSPYCFVQPHLNGFSGCCWGSVPSRFSLESTTSAMFPRSLYRLLAVVVHSGEATSGHFVTFRRGVEAYSDRWFFTSDTVVYEVTIHDVLSAPAYMLFYERDTELRLVLDKDTTSVSSC